MKPRSSLPWSQQPATAVCHKPDDSSQCSHDLFAKNVLPPLSSTPSSPNFSVVFIFHFSRQWRWTVPTDVAAFSLVDIDRRFGGTYFFLFPTVYSSASLANSLQTTVHQMSEGEYLKVLFCCLSISCFLHAIYSAIFILLYLATLSW